MKLSVIIPLYNAKPFIGQTIESVLSQENIEIECIVVDDDSTDNSKEVVKKYPVIYYHKENGGASAARNFGISRATGDYIMFVDADDFLSDNGICWQCINKIEKEQLDFCLFTYQYYNDATSSLSSPVLYKNEWESIIDAEKLLHTMVKHGHFPASPCFRVLKRSFVENNKLYFKEGTTSEDILWYIRVLIASNRFSLINANAYKYRKGVASSVTGSGSLIKCLNFAKVLQDCVSCITQVKNINKRNLLFSALNYEYMILLANSYPHKHNILLWKKLKSLDFLFNYTIFPKSKYLKWFHLAFGLHMTCKILNWYSLNKSKSNI
ncbi:MAG: glycosyltransferase family 2 protein [Bacteroidales bacterium]|nr:glycosyltransferase family 2 protein [Bacteroidales bacterium]